MAKSVSIEDFASEVVGMMKTYTEDIEDAIDENIEILGQQGADELKSVILPDPSESGTANPSNRRVWKNYSKNWKAEHTKGTNYSQSIIRNKKYAPLTHLLEYGHATQDGKRTRAFKHVKPVEEKLNDKLLKTTIKIIEKGGKI